jgi:GT2 family glycosyltransferase
MQLNEYIGKEKYLDGIVQYHQSNFKFDDLKERIFMQLYLGRIPYQVHDEIGYFDYYFSNCGGEDMDYRIRCAIKGYKTMIANHSLTLHFHGKSSWDGNETTEQERIRREQYLERGIKKWGEDLNEIFIKGTNAKEWAYKLGLQKEFDSGESYNIIRKLKNNYA